MGQSRAGEPDAKITPEPAPRPQMAWLRRRSRAAMGTAHLHVPRGSRAELGQLLFGGKQLPATCARGHAWWALLCSFLPCGD